MVINYFNDNSWFISLIPHVLKGKNKNSFYSNFYSVEIDSGIYNKIQNIKKSIKKNIKNFDNTDNIAIYRELYNKIQNVKCNIEKNIKTIIWIRNSLLVRLISFMIKIQDKDNFSNIKIYSKVYHSIRSVQKNIKKNIKATIWIINSLLVRLIFCALQGKNKDSFNNMEIYNGTQTCKI